MIWARIAAAAFMLGATCVLVGYLVGIQVHRTVVEQNVTASETLCPHREDLAISWQGAENSHADTVQFMRRCGWIETGTPLPR